MQAHVSRRGVPPRVGRLPGAAIQPCSAPARLHYLGMSAPGKAGKHVPAARYSYTVYGVTYESTLGGGHGKLTRQLVEGQCFAAADQIASAVRPNPVISK